MMDIVAEDMADLKFAKSLLEKPSLAAKLTGSIGTPIEKGFDLLPKNWSAVVSTSTEKALRIAMDSAILTMKKSTKPDAATNTLHKILIAGSGAAGGFWGIASLAVELPISTTIIMRSIADIARSEGLSIADPQIKVACMEVFALGGPKKGDDAAETGYFAIRSSLAKAVTDAAQHISRKGLAGKSSPILVKLITQISSRFGIQVSEKIAAQAIPVLGAAGGAIINALFIDHFQNMARGHFIVLRLEKKYGPDAVQQTYDML